MILLLDIVLYICAGIGCLVAGVVDVLNCFRVTLEMVPAVAEESDDQKWYTDPECEDQKQYEYDDRHPHKTLTLTLNDEVLLAALLDDIAYPREELIHTLTECFLLARLLVGSLCLCQLVRCLLRSRRISANLRCLDLSKLL